MFIPIVPQGTNNKFVNKEIIYSDTVLPLKELGSNLNVSVISNVSEYSLEECLKVVFKSNPDVVFNTIQYSKNNQTVYFYTEQPITTSTYEERKLRKYNPITSKTEILEEIKNILLSEKNNSSDCISLFDVAQFFKDVVNIYDEIKKRNDHQLESSIKSIFGNSSRCVCYDFKYEKKILPIGFKLWSEDNYKKICFAKENNDLYIVQSESWYDKKIFSECSAELSQIYDEFINCTDYQNYLNTSYVVKPINSNFDVRMSFIGVILFATFRFKNEIELLSPSYTDAYRIECNSGIINKLLKDNEDEIFKRVFVRIDDCPEWCRQRLYEIRQNQLIEERYKEEKETKKQKRLEFARTVFPFLNT